MSQAAEASPLLTIPLDSLEVFPDVSDEERIEQRIHLGHGALTRQLPEISRVFSGRTEEEVDDDFNFDPREGAILKHSPKGIARRGLSYLRDVGGVIEPYSALVAGELVAAKPRTEVILGRLAAIDATMIYQAHILGDGNTRVARAAYGYMHGGRYGMIGAYYADINLKPPQELEGIILEQNMTRLWSNEEPNETDIVGGVYVDPTVSKALEAAMDNVPSMIGTDAVDPKNKFKEYDRVMLSLDMKLTESTGVRDLGYEAMIALVQDEYGPASFALACHELGKKIEKIEDIDAEVARKIVDINIKLLTMRIKSLVAGLANGGNFAVIKDIDHDSTRSRKVTRFWWEPTVGGSIAAEPTMPASLKPSDDSETISSQVDDPTLPGAPRFELY